MDSGTWCRTNLKQDIPDGRRTSVETHERAADCRGVLFMSLSARPRRLRRRIGIIGCAAAALAALAVPSGEANDGAVGDVVQLVRVDTPTWADRDRLTNLGL